MLHSEPIFPLARYDAEGRRLRLKAVGYMERALVTYPKDPNLHRTIDSIMTGLQLTRNLPYSQPQFPFVRLWQSVNTNTPPCAGTPRARRLYDLGVQVGLWAHPDQRPSTMVQGLRGLPWWDKTQIWFSKLIEESYPVIREEMLHAMTLPRLASHFRTDFSSSRECRAKMCQVTCLSALSLSTTASSRKARGRNSTFT